MSDIDIPSIIADIGNMLQDSTKSELDMLKFLNASPKAEWIKDHPMGRDMKYIPIGIIETMLQRIFGVVRIEVKDYKHIANSVTVCVRIHYKSPVTGEWDFQDGLGASPIQIKAGNTATDFANMQTNAIQLALPAAKSYAIKDAAEHIGALFGRDIMRKETLSYTALYPEEIKIEGFGKIEPASNDK